MRNRSTIYNDLLDNSTIEKLQETGKLDIDLIESDVDLYLLVEVLEEDFDMDCYIETLVGGRYLINRNYVEDRGSLRW